jgi:hypothetical protein
MLFVPLPPVTHDLDRDPSTELCSVPSDALREPRRVPQDLIDRPRRRRGAGRIYDIFDSDRLVLFRIKEEEFRKVRTPYLDNLICMLVIV